MMESPVWEHNSCESAQLLLFFDHEYMFKRNTAQTQSAKALNVCPGSAYFKHQQKFFEDHYRVYDGVEGI